MTRPNTLTIIDICISKNVPRTSLFSLCRYSTVRDATSVVKFLGTLNKYFQSSQCLTSRSYERFTFAICVQKIDMFIVVGAF